MQRTAAVGHVSNKYNDRAGLAPGTILGQLDRNTIQEELCHLAELGLPLPAPGTLETDPTYRDDQIATLITAMAAGIWQPWEINPEARQAGVTEIHAAAAHDELGNIVIVREGTSVYSIIASGNWGMTFNPVTDDTAIGTRTFADVCFGQSAFVAVVASGGATTLDKITRSTDGGQTWFDLGPAYTIAYYAVATDGAGNWVAVGSGSTYNVVYSSDNGVTWTNATTSTVHNSNFVFASAAFGNGIFIIGGVDGSTNTPIVYISSDGGDNWTVSTTPPTGLQQVSALAYRAPRGGQTAGDWVCGTAPMTATNYDKIYRSTDDGDTWQEYALPIDVSGYNECFVPYFAYAYNGVFFLGGAFTFNVSNIAPMLLKFSEFGRYAWVQNPVGSDLLIFRDMVSVRGGYVMVGSAQTISAYNYILQSANLL